MISIFSANLSIHPPSQLWNITHLVLLAYMYRNQLLIIESNKSLYVQWKINDIWNNSNSNVCTHQLLPS